MPVAGNDHHHYIIRPGSMCVRPAGDSTGACWRASNCCGHSFFHPLDMLEMHLLAQMSPAATSCRNKRLLLKILNFAWSDLRAVKIAVRLFSKDSSFVVQRFTRVSFSSFMHPNGLRVSQVSLTTDQVTNGPETMRAETKKKGKPTPNS